MDIRYYSEQECQGNLVNTNHSTIHNGCGDQIITNPVFENLFPNLFGENQTYFEISECGGGWPPQWLVTLVIVGCVLCGLCAICGSIACCWWCSFRKRKKKEQNALINNDNQGIIGYKSGDGVTKK